MTPLMRLGADPEIFLVDAVSGMLKASCDKIGGTKDYPRPLVELGEGFAVQEDNVALEYNIPASDTAEAFIKNINNAMQFLSKEVQELGLKFSQQSAALFPETELVHPKALEFGCEPDFDAWTGKVNPKPKAPNPTLRSCGGHVHIGAEMADVQATMRRCDLFLGVPAVLMDTGLLRKQLYGKRGAYRPKPYGGEYRVLSNFWIFSPAHVAWVWNNTQLALNAEQLKIEEDGEIILDAINNNNQEAAKFLIHKYSIPMV